MHVDTHVRPHTCTYTTCIHTCTPTHAHMYTLTHTHFTCINVQYYVPNAVGLFYVSKYCTSSFPSQAALAVVLNEQLEGQKGAAVSQDPFSPFVSEFGMRLNHLLVRDFKFRYGKQGIPLNYLHSLPYKIDILWAELIKYTLHAMHKSNNKNIRLSCLMTRHNTSTTWVWALECLLDALPVWTQQSTASWWGC